MRYARSTLFVGAVAIAAFAMGRMTLPTSAGAHELSASQPDGPIPAEVLAMMQAGTPGDGHKHLESLIGDFGGYVRIWMGDSEQPLEIEANLKREWVLGGRYVREVVTASSEFGDFEGLGYTGYNNLTGQYEFIWMDTDSTAIYSETGSFNPKSGKFLTHGSHRDAATGHIIFTRGIANVSDPDRHVYVTYETGADGVERKSFEGVFERK